MWLAISTHARAAERCVVTLASYRPLIQNQFSYGRAYRGCTSHTKAERVNQTATTAGRARQRAPAAASLWRLFATRPGPLPASHSSQPPALALLGAGYAVARQQVGSACVSSSWPGRRPCARGRAVAGAAMHGGWLGGSTPPRPELARAEASHVGKTELVYKILIRMMTSYQDSKN